MQTVAFLIVAASGLWLIGVAVLMALRPHSALHLLNVMANRLNASDWRLNGIEQGLRVVAGLALIVRSPSSKLPWLFESAGWILVATSVAVIALPVRWHGAYGLWLARRLTPRILRALAAVPAMIGGGLIYLAS